jgi:hypothetical protein
VSVLKDMTIEKSILKLLALSLTVGLISFVLLKQWFVYQKDIGNVTIKVVESRSGLYTQDPCFARGCGSTFINGEKIGCIDLDYYAPGVSPCGPSNILKNHYVTATQVEFNSIFGLKRGVVGFYKNKNEYYGIKEEKLQSLLFDNTLYFLKIISIGFMLLVYLIGSIFLKFSK